MAIGNWRPERYRDDVFLEYRTIVKYPQNFDLNAIGFGCEILLTWFIVSVVVKSFNHWSLLYHKIGRNLGAPPGTAALESGFPLLVLVPHSRHCGLSAAIPSARMNGILDIIYPRDSSRGYGARDPSGVAKKQRKPR